MTPTAEIFEATNEEYHARLDELGHTEIDEFIEDPPNAELIMAGKAPRKPPTPDEEFASLFHAYMLEPHTVVEVPLDVLGRGGIRAGENYKAFALEHPNQWLIKPDEAALLRRMEAAIEEHDKARWIIRE